PAVLFVRRHCRPASPGPCPFSRTAVPVRAPLQSRLTVPDTRRTGARFHTRGRLLADEGTHRRGCLQLPASPPEHLPSPVPRSRSTPSAGHRSVGGACW